MKIEIQNIFWGALLGVWAANTCKMSEESSWPFIFGLIAWAAFVILFLHLAINNRDDYRNKLALYGIAFIAALVFAPSTQLYAQTNIIKLDEGTIPMLWLFPMFHHHPDQTSDWLFLTSG